jgi:hypothetical protein
VQGGQLSNGQLSKRLSRGTIVLAERIHSVNTRRQPLSGTSSPAVVDAVCCKTAGKDKSSMTPKDWRLCGFLIGPAILCLLVLFLATRAARTKGNADVAFESPARTDTPASPAPAPREDPQPALPAGKQETPEVASSEKEQPRTSQDSTGAGATASSGGGGNKTVHVNGYTRKNGTYVAPHDRAAPGNGTSRGGFGGSSRGGSAGS